VIAGQTETARACALKPARRDEADAGIRRAPEVRAQEDEGRRCVTLLMGEVPRLTDNANGYGPAGRGYIAHVDVPRRFAVPSTTCVRPLTSPPVPRTPNGRADNERHAACEYAA